MRDEGRKNLTVLTGSVSQVALSAAAALHTTLYFPLPTVVATCSWSRSWPFPPALPAWGPTSFTVPQNARPGRAAVVFTSGAQRVEVPFTVVAAAAAAPGQGQRSNLPTTGSDQLVPLTITGVALVGIGASIVVASRRRRETMPGIA